MLAVSIPLRQERRERAERMGNMMLIASMWAISLCGAWQIARAQPDPQKQWCMAAIGRYEDMRLAVSGSKGMQLPVRGVTP